MTQMMMKCVCVCFCGCLLMNVCVCVCVQSLVAMLQDLGSTNVATLTLGVVCMVFLYGVKQINERCKARLRVPLPGEIIVVIAATATSYCMGLADRYQVDVVGEIPTG